MRDELKLYYWYSPKNRVYVCKLDIWISVCVCVFWGDSNHLRSVFGKVFVLIFMRITLRSDKPAGSWLLFV